MNKRRRVGSVFVMLGAVLALSALLLFLHNEQESNDAGKAADAALSVIKDAIESNQEESPESDPTESTVSESTDQEFVNIDGYDYIGYLSIPSFGLELPVLDGYGYDMLQIAPCLQYGSPLTDDAVIAGHNYEKHFLTLHKIEPGERVTFTEMNGHVIEYVVAEVQTIDPTAVYDVIESEHDLVLYTCTISGQYRVVVFCDRLERD